MVKYLTEMLKWRAEVGSQTKKLKIFPAFGCGIVLLVILFLIIFLVAQMTGFIRNMGESIPLQTRILMAVSNFLVAYWYLVVAAPFVAWFGLKFAIKTSPAVEYAVDRYKISMPLICPIPRKIILSRVAGSFA